MQLCYAPKAPDWEAGAPDTHLPQLCCLVSELFHNFLTSALTAYFHVMSILTYIPTYVRNTVCSQSWFLRVYIEEFGRAELFGRDLATWWPGEFPCGAKERDRVITAHSVEYIL
jgi:hypothetical protein